jgi:hypothetical protein
MYVSLFFCSKMEKFDFFFENIETKMLVEKKKCILLFRKLSTERTTLHLIRMFILFFFF